MLLVLAAEGYLVDQLQRIAQRIARIETVLDLAEYLADLVFDGIGRGRALLEALQIGEQRLVDIVDQVRSGQRLVVIEFAVRILGRGPDAPAMIRIDDRRISENVRGASCLDFVTLPAKASTCVIRALPDATWSISGAELPQCQATPRPGTPSQYGDVTVVFRHNVFGIGAGFGL